jgi:hypothetical protein
LTNIGSYANIMQEHKEVVQMQIINKLKRSIVNASPKQLVVATAFVAALGIAVGLGMATKQRTSAATYTRDCSANAIDNANINGGCGAASPAELVADIRSNQPGDLQNLYSSFGLKSTDYDRFVKEAKEGYATKDGRIVVDGRTVATNAWSVGRSKKANSWNVNGVWADKAQDVNHSSDQIPVMVLFDDNGAMQFAAMHACGNPNGGDVVKPTFDCKALSKTAVQGEKDTYMFTTDAPVSNGATVAKVVYNFGDGTTETKTDLTAIKHKFTKPGNYTVSVSVTFSLPGGKQKTVEGVKCKTQVTVLAPYYACLQLSAAALNDKKTQFRFTVQTNQGNGATLKDVDFTLDGKNTTTGVVTKDDKGNIYKEYTFAEDGSNHTVLAKVNFNLDGGVTSKTCEAKVTSTKAPMCTVPGKEMFPPNAPECAYCEVPGHEQLPKDSKECVTPTTPQVLSTATELPSTGIGNLFGIFAGTSAAGAVAHRVISSRRRR